MKLKVTLTEDMPYIYWQTNYFLKSFLLKNILKNIQKKSSFKTYIKVMTL